MLLARQLAHGIIQPFKRQRIHRSAHYSMTIIAIILITDPNSGVNWKINVNNLIFTFVTFASGLVVYGIAWYVQKRRGVDVALAYREIPPE